MAGADMFRLNLAHASLPQHTETLAAIRRASAALEWPVAVLVDLAGPKIRLRELPGGEIDCVVNAEFRFVRSQHAAAPDELTTTYVPLVDELQVGNSVMLADGTVTMIVEEKGPDFARCRVTQPGLIRSRQGVNLPGVKLSAPSMDDDDRAAAQWAVEQGVDYLGLSFVRDPRDVVDLKTLVGQRAATRVIAKIEKQEAVDRLDEIIAAADGIMVARGDLGVEISVAQMPLVQKRIVAKCGEHQKPVIIATQMLDSMQHSRRPTRAEATDVANAILDGGDACMLSGETAIGKYPREAVETMNRIALATEELFRDGAPRPPGELAPQGLRQITAAVVYGAGHIAAELDARLIVVASHTGATALALSKQRNYVPTVGISDSADALRRMCLYWGVIPLAGMPTDTNDDMMRAVTDWGIRTATLRPGDHVVLVGGIGSRGGSHNQVVVHQVP
jgi:pyruvate kinase